MISIQYNFDADYYHWHRTYSKGSLKHWCYDWDDLPVDSDCPELGSCVCNFGTLGNLWKKWIVWLKNY